MERCREMKTEQLSNQCRVRRTSILIILTAITLFSYSQRTLAQQWSTNGNDISNTNTGNVGVGTNAPTSKLDVQGRIQQSGSTTDAGYLLTNSSLLANTTALNPGIAFYGGNGVNALYGADLGYNSATGRYRTRVFSGVYLADVALGRQTNAQGNPTQSAFLEFLTVRGDTGNVGIGTASPGERLVTNGNFLAGNITSHTQLFSTYDSQSNVIMELGYGTASPNGTPFPSFVLSKNLTSSNNLLGAIYFANSNIADGNDKRLSAIATFTDGALNSGTLQFYTTTLGTFAERMRITSSGNVGVGTSSPAYRLDVQGGSVNASGGFCMAGDCRTSWSQVAGGGSEWTTSGTNIYYTGGSVGVGTTSPSAKLHVAGDGKFTGNVTVDGNIAAKYQDMAEWVPATAQLSAGTVVVLDATKPNQVTSSSTSYDTRVAGVVSEQPGITLGEKSENKLLIATTGRVRVKVDATNAPVHIGDLLVTSDREGFAMKSLPVEIGGSRMHRPGTLIGKALEPLASGTGEILVLLSLQ